MEDTYEVVIGNISDTATHTNLNNGLAEAFKLAIALATRHGVTEAITVISNNTNEIMLRLNSVDGIYVNPSICSDPN